MDCNNDYIYSDAEAMFSEGKRFLEGDRLEKALWTSLECYLKQ